MPHPGYFYSNDPQRERLRALLHGKLYPEQGEGGDLLTGAAGAPVPPIDGLDEHAAPYPPAAQLKGVKPAASGVPPEPIKGGPPALDPGSFGDDFKYKDSQSAEKDMVDRALGDTEKWVGGGGWAFELYDGDGDDPYVMVTNPTSGTTKRVKPGDKNPDGVDIFEAILAERAYLEANPEVAEKVKSQRPSTRKPQAVARPGSSEGEPLPPGFEPAPVQADQPLGPEAPPAAAGGEYTFQWQPPGNNPPRTSTVRTDNAEDMRWARQMEAQFPVKGAPSAAAGGTPKPKPEPEPEPDTTKTLVFEPVTVVGSRSQMETRTAPGGARFASSPEMGIGELPPDPEVDLSESPAAMRAVRDYVLSNGGTEADARQAEKLAAVYGLNTPRVEDFLAQFAPAGEGDI